MTKTCVDCDRPATWRIYPHDDPDLLDESWYVCDLHVDQYRQGNGVEQYPWPSPARYPSSAESPVTEEST